MSIPTDVLLEIFAYVPRKNYMFRLLNRYFSKAKFLYDNCDVMISIGYRVKITRSEIRWFRNKVPHRGNDLPAVETESPKYMRIWYKNGLIHRDYDRPAYIDETTMSWYRNGKHYCRENDLPAFISVDSKIKREYWYNDKGQLHRDHDLPAIIHIEPGNSYQEWWINDSLVCRDNI